jgi:hypothetical protein
MIYTQLDTVYNLFEMFFKRVKIRRVSEVV